MQVSWVKSRATLGNMGKTIGLLTVEDGNGMTGYAWRKQVTTCSRGVAYQGE
jgi:hypothetical protein